MIRHLLKNLAYTALAPFNFPGAVILLYHSVAANPEFPTVRPEEFERQMAYLQKHNFNVIKLADLGSLLESKRKIQPKTVVLTFDDGYRDNYETAWPILKRYGLAATFFVSSAYLGKDFTTPQGTALPMMTSAQIRELDRSDLIEIASHCHTHQKLVFLSEEEAEKELSESQKVLEGALGRKVLAMAYPWGRFDEAIENKAKKYYPVICTVIKGRTKALDPVWRLKRNSVDSKTSFSQFKGIVKFGRL